MFSLKKKGWDWSVADDASYELIHLPHDFSISLPRAAANPVGSSGGYFETARGYYKREFFAPESFRGKQVLVEFEGIYMNAEVFLNEHFVGRHPYGYTTFTEDLTPFLKIGEKNTLRVVVDNSPQPSTRWYSGSGIYRPAWLLVAEPVHLGHFGICVTTPTVTAARAEVRAAARVVNAGSRAEDALVRFRALGKDGKAVAEAEVSAEIDAQGSFDLVSELSVDTPRLWSPDTPELYTLVTELLLAGKVVDREETTFGIRSIDFSAERGLLLNGQPLKLKGGCVHHDNGVLGAASYARSEERKVELLKQNGYNAVRCAHNPPSPSFLDACDRLGMVVIDEAFDCWRQGKSPYDYHLYYDDWWERDLDSMVLRDRNHPSVFMWSVGNEVMERDGRGGGVAIAQALAKRTRALDPTRPVTAAMCATWDGLREWEDTDPVFAALDVGGYNYQYKRYTADHEREPSRIMYGSETTPGEALENWLAVLELPYVIGDFVWTAWDYLGEAGIGRQHYETANASFTGEYPWHQAYCGDIDLCGFKRPQSYYRDIVWERGEKVYIAVHYPVPEGKTPVLTYWGWNDVGSHWTFPGCEGKPMKVEVYARCDEVELLMDGQSLGKQPTTREEKHRGFFEVPYRPGKLEAVGYVSGREVARYQVVTASAAEAIRLTPDRNVLRAEYGDLCFVTVEIVDGGGMLHPAADRKVYFTAQGPADIVAVGSGDPASTEPYVGNARSTFRGRALVVLRTRGEPGKVLLRAQADGLEAAESVVEVGPR
jgi:beta-galactosidase